MSSRLVVQNGAPGTTVPFRGGGVDESVHGSGRVWFSSGAVGVVGNHGVIVVVMVGMVDVIIGGILDSVGGGAGIVSCKRVMVLSMGVRHGNIIKLCGIRSIVGISVGSIVVIIIEFGGAIAGVMAQIVASSGRN